jgi:hypothetical protein
MTHRIQLSLLITLFIASMASAQAATTVRGRVLAPDGTPYPSAAVTIETSSGAKLGFAYTDREGMFGVRNITAGSYTLRVKTSRSERTLPITARPQAYSDIPPVTLR